MEMTLEEKIKRVAAIIDEALTVQKINPVYIPTAYFKPENLGFPTPRDVFRILRESGAMKMRCWWGYDIVEEGKKQRFVKTDADEPQNDDDFEVYEIEVDERKLRQFVVNKRVSANDVEFDSQNGVIFFGRITHAFQRGREEQLRLKLFQILWDRKKVIRGGKARPKGELFPASAVAVQLGFLEDPRAFSKNTTAKDKLDNLLKNTERTLQAKKLPIRLYQKGGIQIIVNI